MCAPEFPPDHSVISYEWVNRFWGAEKVMELNEKSGRKRRRKRTRPIISEEEEEEEGEVMENFVKRKPTAPVKPPVSKKACVDSIDVTDVVVLDSSHTYINAGRCRRAESTSQTKSFPHQRSGDSQSL